MEFQTPVQYSDQPQKENLFKIILEVIGGVLILFIFLMLGYFGNFISKNVEEQLSLNKGEIPQKEELPQITLPAVLYNLAGTIEKLEKNSLTFEASIIQLNEQKQVTYKEELRKVIVAPTTKFSRLAFVSQEGKEQKAPQETTISFKDLKLKDYIEVVSNQDISQAPEFTAVQIRVLPR